MTAGTGSPGIRSFGLPAGTAFIWQGSGHRVTRHWIVWLDSGHRVTRQRAPDQVRIIWINSRGIESTGLIGSSGWISSSCWVEHQAECRRPAE
ncbi:unnamed protein product [Staurois parvus]|uniref:Uncharacterized protein n=1 Tax=Staurois parvus TaxID=386267 RepID=A0ABN9G5L2_9NEOB|nr:unnamed protein product [Staurois parvus]